MRCKCVPLILCYVHYYPYDLIFYTCVFIILSQCFTLPFITFIVYTVSDRNLFNRNNCQLIQPGHHSARLDLACRMFESLFEVLTECLTDCMPLYVCQVKWPCPKHVCTLISIAIVPFLIISLFSLVLYFVFHIL